MQKIILRVILCLSIILVSHDLFGDPVSTVPFITHYSKITYNAGYENWDIIQSKSGLMYFANNEGLLVFNNKNWRTYPLPNNTIVRSLAIDSSGYIYVGGQNELGYYYANERGMLHFTSLKSIIPEQHRNFEDVWDVLVHPTQGIFFMTANKLFRYYQGQMIVYSSSGLFYHLNRMDSKVIIQDNKTGLNVVTEEGLEPLPDSDFLNSSLVTDILNMNNGKFLITTLKNGIYTTDGVHFQPLEKYNSMLDPDSRIYSADIFTDGRIVLGTTLNGLFILKSDGAILQHVNESNGLNDNKVLSVFVDQSQNLWLGLENGIDYLHTSSPFSLLSTTQKIEGAGYDIEILDNMIYFGTSKKVFFSTRNRNSESSSFNTLIREIPSIRGQVWGFNLIDDKVFMGHHEGGFINNKSKINKISKGWGVWLFQELQSHPGYLIAGTYTGLSLFVRKSESWEFVNEIKGFEESSRFLEQDEFGNIWVAHPYKGIYKMKLNENLDSVTVRKYGESDGLYSNISNYLFKINKELVFCTRAGIYSFNYETDRFEPNNAYNKIFGPTNPILRLYEAPSGNIWYVSKNDIGMLKVTDKSLSKDIVRKSFKGIRNLMVSGFELIYPYNDSNIYIGSEGGFIHLNPQREIDTCSSFSVIFDEISLSSTSKEVLFRGILESSGIKLGSAINSDFDQEVLPSQMNSLFFSFSSTDYSSKEHLRFRYYLEGLEKYWSDWEAKTEKEYSHLRPGTYKFHVQSQNQTGLITPASSYQFTILPPWYFSKLAYLIYVFAIIGVIVWISLLFWKKYRFQRERVIHTEKKLKNLEEQRLQDELNYKSRELISASLHIGHKITILSEIEREIEKIVKQVNDTISSNHLRKIIKIIHDEEGKDKEIRHFTNIFNDIHPGFLDRVVSKYPDLSSTDLKMCAYIRMNMSTKEIATILNMTIRGVEGARYRLRKKIKLPTDTDLASFIIQF